MKVTVCQLDSRAPQLDAYLTGLAQHLQEQVAGIVTFLCSDAASQITGTTISADGGWSAQ